MAFPTGTSNGQTTTINGVVYVYSASDNAWTRISTPFGNLSINDTLTTTTGVILGNLYANANIIAGNVKSNTSTVGTLFVSTASISSGTTQQDVLNLNNNNLYGVNTIRINDPGTSEGITWEGGSGWYIYESPDDLSNNIGNLQIVRNNVRTLTVDTFGGVNIPNTKAATSTTTGALTVGGGVGIGGNLWVAGNIYTANLISIGSYTLNVQDPLLYLTAPSLGSYNYDIGLYSQFIGGSLNIYQHTGLARNYTNNTWGLFSNVVTEPGTTINWSDTGLIWDTLKVGAISVANTTTSTSTSTGALVVSGGVGIAGPLFLTNTGDVSANIGAYQIYANANAAAQASSLDTINTNIGAFYTYANTKIGTNTNGNLVITATTASTNFSTGALVVAGGAAIAGSAYVDKLYSTQGLYWAGNGIAISTGGGGGGSTSPGGGNGALQFNNGGSFDGAAIIYDNVSGNLVIASTTNSTNTATGALVVAGGVGIAGSLNIANTGDVSANIGILVAGNSTTQANIGAFYTYANTKIGTNPNSNLVVVSTTTSTSNTTGALVVRGGVGVAGNVYADALYTTTGIRWAGNGVAFSSGGTGLTYTAATVPPTTGNVKGDQWYNTTTDVLYEYINDGTTSYWVDVQSLGTSTGNAVTVNFNDLTLGGNIILTSNLVYSIGGGTGQLKFIYAGNIIGVTANVATINTGNIVALSNITAANIVATTITATGNVQGNYMLGNGSKLTNLPVTGATTGKAIAMAIVFGG